jgi:hypothetical protein
MFERIRQVPRLLRDLRDPDKIVLKTRFLELHFERKKQQTK